MPAQDIRLGGYRGSRSIETSLAAMVTTALERRTRCEPPTITKQQLENLCFERIKDQHLFNQFAKRFPTQVVEPGCVKFVWHSELVAWKLSFDGKFAVQSQADNKYCLFRHREPEAFDQFQNWMHAHKKVMLESEIGMEVFCRAIEWCKTTVDVEKIWPGLLKLDRSGRYEEHTGRERPSKVEVSEEHRRWIPVVEQWVTEGLLVKDEPKAHLFKHMKLDGMVFRISHDLNHIENNRTQLKLPQPKPRIR